MNIALWIVQGLLALGFLYSGWLKAFRYDAARASWPWAGGTARGLVFFIGIAELAGAIGLIVPRSTGAAPVLTPLAAAGLAVVVLLGAALHVRRGEYKELGINLMFLALAAWVALGRM